MTVSEKARAPSELSSTEAHSKSIMAWPSNMPASPHCLLLLRKGTDSVCFRAVAPGSSTMFQWIASLKEKYTDSTDLGSTVVRFKTSDQRRTQS